MRISILLSGVLFAMLAHAEWQDAGVPGTPNDVRVWGPETFSVATSAEARLFLPDGGTVVIPGDSVATWLGPDGCFRSMERPNGRLVGVGCASGTEDALAGGYSALSMRGDEAGALFVVGAARDGSQLAYKSVNGGLPPTWVTQGLPDALQPTGALGVLSHGGLSHALIGGAQFNGLLRWERLQRTYGGLEGDSIVAPFDFPGINSIDLFNGGGVEPSALLGTEEGLYRLELGDLGQWTFLEVPLPTGKASVAEVDVNTGTGSAAADGFGMAVVTGDGSSTVLSAVPASDPSKVGSVWRENPTFSVAGVELNNVACFGAEFCVLTSSAAGSGNVFIYRNAHAPDIAVPDMLTVPEGTSTPYLVKVSDADGDAVRAWAEGFTDGPLTVNARTFEDGRVELEFIADKVCEDTSISTPVRVFASDGLASHEREASIPIVVQHTIPPEPPDIEPETIVAAGVGSMRLEAAPGPGCTPTGYIWTAMDGAPVLTQDGSAVATFPVPPVTCEPLRFNYEVQARDSAGDGRASPFTVVVMPWGEPSAAFADNSTRELIAGGRVRVEPDARHTCEGAAGFPGVRTVWSLGDLKPGVRVFTDTGEEVSASSSPVTSSFLDVSAEDCMDVMVPLTAYHQTEDAAGARGPDSTVQVAVKTQLNAVSEGTLLLSAREDVSGKLTGAVDVQGLNCMGHRTGDLAVKARLHFLREDGSEVGSLDDVSVPGEWTYRHQEGCGGTLYIRGRLLDASGAEVGDEAMVAVSTHGADAALESLAEEPSLVAVCGQGARGTLTQTVPAGACQAARFSWTQVDGPALTQAAYSGQTVELATQETELDALVGHRVRVRVTADAGSGNAATREHEVPITAEPFIEAAHETEKPTGSESGLLGVSVGLRNLTTCGVGDVLLEETLEGMEYVPGSARLDGQPVDVERVGDTLRVRGLAFQGGAVHRFTYVARPALLGAPRMATRLSLREVPISLERPVPPASGCGCASGGSGAATLGLVALVLRGLRRTTGRS